MGIVRSYGRWLPGMLAAVLLMGAVVAPGEPEPSDPQDRPEGSSMPEWTEKDQKSVLLGKWWDSVSSLLPGVPSDDEKDAPIPAVSASETSPVDPFPENFERVDEQFLPQYIRPSGIGLIDPQKLLTEVERDDVLLLMARLQEQFGIHVYVSIFAKGQSVPPEVNAPTLARQVFQPGERSMLLHVHLGDVQSMQIAADQEMNDAMGDRRRRIVLHHIKENASVFTDPMDQLLEAMAAMAHYAREESREAMTQTKPGISLSGTNIPSVNVEITEPEGVKKNSIGALVKVWEEEMLAYRDLLLIGLVGVILFATGYFWFRSKRPVHLLPSEADVRLGAPHGAGISRGINYGDREGTQPDSVSRQQMRDHMRDIS